VLELIVADLLFNRDESAREGTLTLRRAGMVSTGALAGIARGIDLGAHLRVGRGVDQSGGRDLDSLLANALEAVFGAIYLEKGLRRAARAFEAVTSGVATAPPNFKGMLQEWSQSGGAGVPRYHVVDSIGPGHKRRWRVEVSLAGEVLAQGEGASRRAAEQAAAETALQATAGGPAPPRGRAQDVVSGDGGGAQDDVARG
jgi:ribonuclease-3